MISFFVINPLLTACAWALLYFFDYSMTLWFSHLYRQWLSQYFIHEGGVEMNPVFEKDVANLRSSLPHFLVMISLVMAILILFGKIGPDVGDFEFLAGAALLLWTFINLQHIRNIYLYIHMRIRPNSIEGQIKQTYWLNQRLVAYEAFTFAVIYGLVWTTNGTHFFLGGAFACFGLAIWHFSLAGRTVSPNWMS